MIPIRCYTCGTLISKSDIIKIIINSIISNNDIDLFKDFSNKNYCCNIPILQAYQNLKQLSKSDLQEILNKL
jgi:DNA-directed RNA polymerase subunit N (RpoN/RPB10)